MVCVPTGAETGAGCFDGIDNDCDGHIDCDDPDCSAAECVPTPSAGFTLGITTTPTGFCPAMFASDIQINEGLSAPTPDCPSGGCTCTGVMNCSSQTTSWPMDTSNMCMGEGDGNSATSAQCRNFNVEAPTKGITTDVLVNGGGTCNSGGTSTKSTAAFTSSDLFCKTTAMGGGCAAGMVCVPKLAVQTCELAPGVVACDSGYNATAGTWYTGMSDTRSCQCECGGASGGACGSSIGFYTSTDCSGTAALTLGPNASCTAFTGSIKTLRLNGSTNPGCGGATTMLSGSLSGTGAMTMCCRP
jgi:hypothetical protein